MKTEDISAHATVAQAIILAIQSCLLIWTINVSRRSIEISRKQLYVAKRPWVSAIPTILKFEINRKDVCIHIMFLINNCGGSFSNNVNVIAKAIAVKPNMTRPGDALSALHKSGASVTGTISIPGQPSGQPIYLSLDRTSIESAKTETHDGIMICLYGFVEYQSTIDNTKHYTDFSYVLGEPNGDSIKDIVDIDGDLDHNQIRFMNVGSSILAT